MDLGISTRTAAVAAGSAGLGFATARALANEGVRVVICSRDAARVADVYVTSDLRHHRAQDHLVDGGCALVDVAHWASEWPWLPVAAGALRTDLAALGSTVEVHVSTIPTDPWTRHRGSTR